MYSTPDHELKIKLLSILSAYLISHVSICIIRYFYAPDKIVFVIDFIDRGNFFGRSYYNRGQKFLLFFKQVSDAFGVFDIGHFFRKPSIYLMDVHFQLV